MEPGSADSSGAHAGSVTDAARRRAGAAAAPVRVAIALGSNLGDRHAALRWASDILARFIDQLRVSSFVESAPVGVDEPQPWYLNGAASGLTVLPPRALLEELQSLERARGRVRTRPNAARTLDLDLILYGDVILNEGDLIVPHPRFRDREFVLAPLAEIAGDMVDPVTGRSVGDLAADLTGIGPSARGAGQPGRRHSRSDRRDDGQGKRQD